MKIVLTGSNGLVGSALCAHFQSKGHDVYSLVRKKNKQSDHEIYWNPYAMEVDVSILEKSDVVIHLSGENIADGRWNDEKRKKIIASRVDTTRFLSETLSHLKHKPALYLTASAIGFFGDRGAEILHDESSSGTGFLADTAKKWEEASWPAVSAGIRTIQLRFGMILTPKGGALSKMLPIFKKGLGAVFGNGKQYWSWIALDDVVGIIDHLIMHQAILRGPLNVVSPKTITHKEFVKTLGRVLRRPVLGWMPAALVSAVFGEMGRELFLSSQRVEPARLTATKYLFKYPDLETALNEMLRKNEKIS